MLVTSAVLVVAAALITLFDSASLAPFSSRDPGSDSDRARRQLAAATGVEPDFGLLALVRLAGKAGAPASRVRVARVAGVLDADPQIARVITPSLRAGDPLTASDQRSALVVGELRAGALAGQLDAAAAPHVATGHRDPAHQQRQHRRLRHPHPPAPRPDTRRRRARRADARHPRRGVYRRAAALPPGHGRRADRKRPRAARRR